MAGIFSSSLVNGKMLQDEHLHIFSNMLAYVLILKLCLITLSCICTTHVALEMLPIAMEYLFNDKLHLISIRVHIFRLFRTSSVVVPTPFSQINVILMKG